MTRKITFEGRYIAGRETCDVLVDGVKCFEMEKIDAMMPYWTVKVIIPSTGKDYKISDTFNSLVEFEEWLEINDK